MIPVRVENVVPLPTGLGDFTDEFLKACVESFKESWEGRGFPVDPGTIEVLLSSEPGSSWSPDLSRHPVVRITARFQKGKTDEQ